MLDYAQLEALIAVTREGSFEAAARSLGLTSSAVSQRIKRLEERIGAIVVNRCLPPSPTTIGSLLCRHAEMVQMLETEILSSSGWTSTKCRSAGTKIKIIVDEASLSSWFIDALALESEMSTDNLFEIALVDPGVTNETLMSGSAFAALSFSDESVQGFKSIYLGTQTFRATASPDYVKRHFSDGVTLAALSAAPALRHSSQDDLQQQWSHQILGGTFSPRHHTIPSAYGCVAACQRGIAWGLNPASMVDELIEEGDLVELVCATPLKKKLYWHVSFLIADVLSGFTRNVRRAAHRHLEQTAITEAIRVPQAVPNGLLGNRCSVHPFPNQIRSDNP